MACNFQGTIKKTFSPFSSPSFYQSNRPSVLEGEREVWPPGFTAGGDTPREAGYHYTATRPLGH